MWKGTATAHCCWMRIAWSDKGQSSNSLRKPYTHLITQFATRIRSFVNTHLLHSYPVPPPLPT
jgi:hypothetical protein